MARGIAIIFLLTILFYGAWRLMPKRERKQWLRETWFQALCAIASMLIVGLLWGLSQ